MEFVDRSGKTVVIPDDQAADAYLSGQYGLKTGKVDVRDPEGNLGQLDGKELGDALKQGFELVPPEQAQKIRDEKEYGGVGGGVIAAGEGAARGLTFGLSDAAATAIGGDAAKKHLQKYRDTNPISSTVGEVGGMLAPILLSGGAAAAPEAAIEGANLARAGIEGGGLLARGAEGVGAVTKALGVVPRAVDAGAGLAERGVQALVGTEAESLLGRAVQKGLTSAARGVLEGGAAGAGSAISEDALGDHKLTGERLLAAIGHGALFGAVTGGALGAGGEVLGTVGRGIAQKVSGAAKELAEEQAFRALNPTKRLVSEADRIPGGSKAVGRYLIDEGLVQAGDDIEAIAPRIEAAKSEAGGRIGSLLEQAEAAGVRVDTERVASRIEKEVSEKLYRSANLNRSAIAKVDDTLKDFLAVADKGSIRDLQNFRRTIDDAIGPKWNTALDTATSDSLKSIRSIVEDEVERAGDAASTKMDSSWVDEYRAAKADYQKLKVADNAAQGALEAKLANRGISLSDYMTGIGSGVGSMLAHPASAAVGLATTMAHKVVRERGNATAAVLLDHLADLGAVKKVTDGVDRAMTRGVDSFIEGKAAPRSKVMPLADEFDEAVRSTRAAAASPNVQANAVQRHLKSIMSSAPKVAAEFSSASARAVTYLASKVPRGAQRPPDPLQPALKQQQRVSDADMASFLRTYRAVDDPQSVVHDMQRGRLTPEAVESLRVVYPSIYADLQAKALAASSRRKKPLTYAQKVQLGTLLNVATDPSLKPERISAYQGSFNHQSPSGSGSSNPGTPPKRMLKAFGADSPFKLKGQ